MEVIVIGGSAAGLKAACRIARLKPDAAVKVLVRDRYFGVSACGMAFYLAGDIDDFKALISTPNGTVKDEVYYRDVKGIEVLARREVLAIDRAARLVRFRELDTGREKSLPYDKLVIATGAEPLVPAIPGVDSPGVAYFADFEQAVQLRHDLERGMIERVAIVGAGFVGLELCEAFRAMWGVEVELIELQPQVLPGLVDPELAVLVEEELIEQGVSIRLGCRCNEIVNDENHICVFDLAGEGIHVDRVIITVGVRPNVDLARAAGLEIGSAGGIKVDAHLATNDPDIFAAGDCVELVNALNGRNGVWSFGSLASRMGRVVGDNVCNGDSQFNPIVCATVFKVFDITVGTVGMTAVECRSDGYEIGESWGTFHDRLFYYPGATTMNVKLVYDKSSGEVLGFQGLSRGSLLHEINAASQLIRQRVTVDKLPEFEHAYSPPFAQPLDPLHYLAYIADNSRSAGIGLVPPHEFLDLPTDTVVLDSRSPHEIESRPLDVEAKRRIEIPVEKLRSRIREVPSDAQIVTVCQTGGRSWDAALMLRRAGWNQVSILAGGALFLPKSSADRSGSTAGTEG